MYHKMPGKKFTVLIGTLTLAAVSLFAMLSSPLEQFLALTEEPLMLTESGVALDGLFEGLARRGNSVDDDLVVRQGCRSVAESVNGLLSDIAAWVDPLTVEAVECSAGDCAGHNAVSMCRPCTFSCAAQVYCFHYYNSQIGDWDDGWKYSGNAECGGCRCEEEFCPN